MDYRSQIKEKMGKLLFLEMNIKGFKERSHYIDDNSLTAINEDRR